MKLFYLFIVVFFVGCKSQETKQESIDNVDQIDSMISQSNVILQKSDSMNVLGEKLVTKKLENTKEKMETLEEKVLTLKRQVNFVKTEIIYKTDTIYVESKKNFWGREKIKTYTKSDSISIETIDSLNN